jgi:ferredoxin
LIPGSQRQQEGETAVETRKVADKREAKKSCPVKKIVIQSN